MPTGKRESLARGRRIISKQTNQRKHFKACREITIISNGLPPRSRLLIQSCPRTDFPKIVAPRLPHPCKPLPRPPRPNRHLRAASAERQTPIRPYQKQRDSPEIKENHTRPPQNTSFLISLQAKLAECRGGSEMKGTAPGCRPRFKFRRPIRAQYWAAWPGAL